MDIKGYGGRDLRFWCYVGGDGGVIKLKLFHESPFASIFVPVIGYFHEMAVFIRMVMKIAWGLGVAPLAAVFGVASPMAKKWLTAAKDLHKAYQFFKLVYEAASIATADAWLETEPVARDDPSAFRGWLTSSAESDKHFSNVAYFFLTGCLPSIILTRKGLRTNNYAAWLGGGMLLLPLMFVRGHTNFAGLSVQDRGSVCFRAPDKVKRQRMAFLSIDGVPFDERLEMTNGDVISNIADNQKMSYMIAVACRDVGIGRRKALFETCGVLDHQYQSRSDPQLQPAIDRIVEFFKLHRTFVPVAGRSSLHSLDLRSLLPDGGDLLAITARGNVCMSSYVTALRGGEPAPKIQRISEPMNVDEVKMNAEAAITKAARKAAKAAAEPA